MTEAKEQDPRDVVFATAVTLLDLGPSVYNVRHNWLDRLSSPIWRATRYDPDWVRGFVPYLRSTLGMREAAIVAAVEYVAAGGHHGRQVVDAACQRPDDPSAVLARWTRRYGRSVPKPIKRGVADAARRLYTERAVLDYDLPGSRWRFADVLEVVHARPEPGLQTDLFEWIVKSRRDPDFPIPTTAARLRSRKVLLEVPPDERLDILADFPAKVAADIGTMRDLIAWVGAGSHVTTPPLVWDAAVSSMDYRTLLGRLDPSTGSVAAADQVAARIADPAEVEKSGLGPLAFVHPLWAASKRYEPAVTVALDHAIHQWAPSFPGRTLVMVDASRRGRAVFGDSLALFAAAIAKEAVRGDLFAYGESAYRVDTSRPVRAIVDECGTVNAGMRAETAKLLLELVDAAVRVRGMEYDQIVIVTADQEFDVAADCNAISQQSPIFAVVAPSGRPPSWRLVERAHNRFRLTLGDAAFKAMGALDPIWCPAPQAT